MGMFSGGRDVILSGAVAPHNGRSGVVVVFVFEGDAKLRAVGGDFAVFDHHVKLGDFANAQIV